MQIKQRYELNTFYVALICNYVHFQSSTTLDEICIYCFVLWMAINYLRRIIPRCSLTGIISSFLYLD